MGTLGAYLSSAREALGIDLHEAAQQTRISINYLKAMESEDFSRLPGEVFVRGFLKSYAKYLKLDEAEVLKRYQELRQAKIGAPAAQEQQKTPSAVNAPAPAPVKRSASLIEPLAWAAAILIIMIILLLVALPGRQKKTEHAAANAQAAPGKSAEPETARDKLYLEIAALEDTWVLVRTDASPQKKAVLKKGESVIWSADERFLLSYGSAGAVRLTLNGNELIVQAPKNAVVRDLVVTVAGIVDQKIPAERPAKLMKPKPQAAQNATTPARQEPPQQQVAPTPAQPGPQPQQQSVPAPAQTPALTTAPIPSSPQPQ